MGLYLHSVRRSTLYSHRLSRDPSDDLIWDYICIVAVAPHYAHTVVTLGVELHRVAVSVPGKVRFTRVLVKLTLQRIEKRDKMMYT